MSYGIKRIFISYCSVCKVRIDAATAREQLEVAIVLCVLMYVCMCVRVCEIEKETGQIKQQNKNSINIMHVL